MLSPRHRGADRQELCRAERGKAKTGLGGCPPQEAGDRDRVDRPDGHGEGESREADGAWGIATRCPRQRVMLARTAQEASRNAGHYRSL